MKASEVRQSFLDFFAEREHRVVRSSPLVLPNDPTLLFANAGMNQFKDVFTGRETRSFVRAASSQKCLRVAGKHNDLEMVGRTPRHHTFFEMLGNFSFGDYFKRESIRFAWDLVTGLYGIPQDRLWVSVFGGSEAFEPDEEAERIWREEIGVPTDRILRLGEKENFWRMGEVGPCGPCSEIHFDLGADLASAEPSNPETDERRFLEIWNLVFMQYDQRADGLVELPAPSIDTGMGLERITSVLQGRRSNYETDLFRPLLDAIGRRAGTRYGEDRDADDSMRIIADHARALCFLVADGVVPANDRRGYVLRRLLRRAIRHGRKLGIDEPFLHEVTPALIDTMSDAYPELAAARDAILEVGRREEQRFAETLSTGLQMIESTLDTLAGDGKGKVLPGAEVFRLYDTFGFPLDLARDIAEERGVTLDEEGFEAEMAKQRARAKASFKGAAKSKDSAAYAGLADSARTEFVGHERTELDDTEVLAILAAGKPASVLRAGEEGEIFLQATPFYAEAGGQVGDRGWLTAADTRVAVLDTQRPLPDVIAHRVRVESGEVAVGDHLDAAVDGRRRLSVQRNHTATHLLHAALRELVGTHVKQAGSLVAPDRLRFDFSHFAGLSPNAVEEIEELVNDKVMQNVAVESEVMDLDEALRQGAMALFGEKYGDRVRVVRMGEFSLELCGGTHCGSTAEVGLFKLTHERGVASGTRRVEAVTGFDSLRRMREQQAVLGRLESMLAVSEKEVAAEVERRLSEARRVERELEQQRITAARKAITEQVSDAQVVEGIKVMARRVEGVSAREMRELADGLRRKLGSGVVVLGRAEPNKASLLVAVTDDVKGRLPAGDLVRALAAIIKGGGGGRPDMAEAGGKDPSKLDEALAAAAAEVSRRLKPA